MTRGRKTISISLLALMASLLPGAILAQNNELGLTLEAGRSWNAPGLALQAEVHFLVNPLRDVSSTDQRMTKDFATLAGWGQGRE
jgi:hypothetical protein